MRVTYAAGDASPQNAGSWERVILMF